MKISVGKDRDLTTFKKREVNKEELCNLIVTRPYSLSIFRNDYRNLENFISADLIAIDVDEGMTIKEAKEIFNDFKYLIAPSRNHNRIKVKKSGKELPACERFRIIFPLSKTITDIKVFYNTWFYLQSLAPKIDPACKDPSRFFYASTEILHIHSGKPLDPVLNAPIAPRTRVDEEQVGEGRLASKTLRFLLQGAKDGFKHTRLQKAAIDAHEQGYTKEWFLSRIDELVERTGEESYRDSGALKTINDMFNKEPKYEKREEKNSFKINKIADLMKGKTEINWTVQDLLSEGGLSLIAGAPKIGKSTLVRQLITCIVQGKDFLKRKVKKGPVIYLAFEEQEEIINSSFKRLGIKPNDDLYIHVGSPMAETKHEDIIELIQSLKPKMVVIDTIGDFIDTEVNDYNGIKKSLADLRTIARDNNCHICLIHHSRKPYPGRDGKIRLMGADGILGSQAIVGGVDCFMVIESEGDQKRYLSSGGRSIKRWFQIEIKFMEKHLAYKLGSKRSSKDYG